MSNEFPAFIKAEYVEGDAFSRFQQDVTRTLDGTKQRFERSFAEIGNVIAKAISRPAGAGKIDIGLPDFRQAAADARLYQASIEATLNSARTLAQATGDVSARTKSYLQALMAQNNEAKQAVTTAEAQVETYTRLQSALNATADANSRLAQAQREVYAEQARAAQIEVQQRNRQAALNQVFAPGLTSRATDNGAGFGALDEMVRQQQAAAALRAELDPLFAAQQRFNEQVERASALLRAGAISTKEYEQAQALANRRLREVEEAQGRGTTATRINTESQRANRFAMIQAGQQLQDITVSLQSGQRATTVFAQQLPQLAFAFTDVCGKVGAFAQFLAGPWGVAVFGAVTVLGLMIERLFDTGEAAKKEANGLDFNIMKVRELEAAIRDLNDEKVKALQTSYETEKQAIREAEANRLKTITTLKDIEASLQRRITTAPASRVGVSIRNIEIENLKKDLEAARAAIAEAERGVRIAQRGAVDSATRAALDPATRAQREYEKALSREQKLRDANSISAEEYAKRLAQITRARDAELKAIREAEKLTRGRGPSDPGETTRFLSPISGSLSAPFGQQRGNRRHAGVDIAAPVGTAVRAPADGTIIEIGNDPGGYGNYVIIDHGRGTKTRYAHLLQTTRSRGSAVTAGEVFARSGGAPGAPGSGNSRGAHLHYEVLRNGKAVDPMKGLFPTDSLNVAREAEQALEQLAGRIQNLQDRFDPATKAANDFAEALATIKEAEGAGLISEQESFELQIKAMAEQYGAYVQAQNEATDRFMKVFEPQQMRSAAEEYADYLEEKWAAAQDTAASAFVRAVEGADLMQAIFSGRFRLTDLFRMINPNDSRLRTGATAGDSGLNRFLFGKASNFREIAEGKPEIQGGLLQSYTKSMNDFQDAMRMALEEVLGPNAANIGEVLGSALANAQIGSQIAGVTGGNRTAGAVGGILGSELGKSLAKGPLGSALGKLSGALGPLGGIVGGIALGAIGSALTPAKRGSATIGGSGGTLSIASTRGNSKSRIAQSSDSAGEAITTLERIAEALGGTIDASRGSVSIGVRDKNFRVDTTGSGITKTKRGAIDFGQDSAAAIKFATMDLIKDGVITGLRASTQRLLQNSKDLDEAIRKATDFQGVFDRLQEKLDPVGAAITGVDREFDRLRKIFAEAGASAEEYADLEKLYQMERTDAIKEANERVLGSMKALLDDLRFGDNGRSLRDRLAAAQAKFDPLAARVQAGDITAYDDFAEAARALLDIQRQFSGSQAAFFDLQDRITAITAKVVEGGGNVTSILPGSTPTAQQQAQQAYDGSAAVVTAIDQLGDRLISALGVRLEAINDNISAGPPSGGRSDIPGFFAQNVRQI